MRYCFLTPMHGCPKHNKKKVNVSCDYSLWPPSLWVFCMAPGTKHPVEQTITKQMHLRFNLKQPTTSHSSPNVLSFCPASPSVPIFQANQVPVFPADWPYHLSRCPGPICEPKLSFLQQPGRLQAASQAGSPPACQRSGQATKEEIKCQGLTAF